ncbi:Splicing factor 3A subunit 3 [Trichoplax sp. H2]|uniref:Matrin-type domain-containing protein n=1 Tax=Trichoplax adhaerens TaxID=10228 RepID=B3RXQ8_TRIAD|nr:hypothetical protein TRIADDRAFT_25606 [Trichoplax adhaerens]EDV24471.1 hypothetical protein TRIADDRAFT_25606 [Trichoplax adhaerens]RDD46727.1 Splicing factor 3A subunit 3 [Trichoplax sp. H2]|eukprot:XP_002112361.1 hypothetical protein TRIADDRAFT_25606 [Trichoplax adhaerens]
MDSIIEQQRGYHEELERVEDAMIKENLRKKISYRDQINSQHYVKQLLERATEISELLVESYEDGDELRKEEVQSVSGSNEFAEFYRRYKSLKDYYARYPADIQEPMQFEFLKMQEAFESQSEDVQNLVTFTDEEGYGKYLDLHECHERYNNLKGLEHVDYLTYITTFDQLFEVPKEKKNNDYKDYLDSLLKYLFSYLERIKPLLDLDKEYDTAKEDFENKWSLGTFPGWPKDAGSALSRTGAALDLSAFSSSEELMSLGLDRLKSALMALGLKCGGTLEERAKRLFSTKGKTLDQIDSSLFTKTKTGKGHQEGSDRNKEIAGLEAQIYHTSELLGTQRSQTRENIERKLARTAEELEEEEEVEQYSESESDDDGEEGVLYNPKNLPLGWDGKPIPYWLYKLHGLNIYYDCEICGNYSYRGPKAFQRHFAEWRHAHGMRCLGIPNTAHFANVTKIKDALSLWDKLKDSKTKERFDSDAEEEFEDSFGNVVNRKVYDDLRKQGLL